MIAQALKRTLLRMPIQWTLTLWSVGFIFVLFIAYNTVQYLFVEQWMIGREKAQVRHKMNDILNGLLEGEARFTADELPRIRRYLDKMNRNDQLIRIIDPQGNKVIAVSDGIPEEWIAPKRTAKTEIAIAPHSGHSLLVMRSPITIHSFYGTVEIVRNMDQFHELTRAILQVFILSGLGAIVLSGVGGGLLTRQLLKPLQSLAQTMRNVERRGLKERVAIPDKKDEITALMSIFNGMMDQVERSFARQSQFVEDASHELRTPIAIMDGHLSLLLRWGKHDPEILEESLSISYQELTRLKALVEDLLTLTRAEQDGQRADEGTRRADRTILGIVGQWEQLHPERTFETAFAGFADREVAICERHLEQLMTILLDNAVKYSEASSPVRVRGSVHGDKALFEVTDYGIGIPEKDLPHVTERFYRVDKARSRKQGGTGLGLAIAKQLVERYGGSMTIQSKELAGTTVTISLSCRLRTKKKEVESNETAG